MKIAIIGGGYTGLATAYYLSKKDGVHITLFEKEKGLGGLASGYKSNNWKWSLDKYYHHIFTTDSAIRRLAKEVSCSLFSIKPKTSIYYAGKIYSFDSAIDLLRFPHVSLVSRIRTGIIILLLKIITYWKPLERISAQKLIQIISGKESWEIIWQPLFVAKFGEAASQIPASWFWSRIKKRGRVFLYPKGGFDALTKAIVKEAKRGKSEFITNTEVKSVKIEGSKILVKTDKGDFRGFDKVICTLPFSSFTKIIPNLPRSYIKKLNRFEYRGTVNLILSLRKKFLIDGTYWLNINNKTFPFVGIVEQTNFIPDHKYNSDNIIHVVNYLAPNHPFFKTSNKSLTVKFLPYLRKINPEFTKSWIKKSWVFKSKSAQPIITMNYSKKVPAYKTPVKNVYLANMQQIYPWDRQTNYAVELGKKISKIILKAS